MIERILKPNRHFEFWKDEEEFYRLGARALRSNCVLDVSKLLVAGIKMRPVEEALEDSLRNWDVATLRADNGAARNVSLFSSLESGSGIQTDLYETKNHNRNGCLPEPTGIIGCCGRRCCWDCWR